MDKLSSVVSDLICKCLAIASLRSLYTPNPVYSSLQRTEDALFETAESEFFLSLSSSTLSLSESFDSESTDNLEIMLLILELSCSSLLKELMSLREGENSGRNMKLLPAIISSRSLVFELPIASKLSELSAAASFACSSEVSEM